MRVRRGLRRRTGLRRGRVRRVLDLRRLQRAQQQRDLDPLRARLHRRSLQRVHVEQSVRRRPGVRPGNLRHLRPRFAVRTERTVRRQLLRVLRRCELRVRTALRSRRLRLQLSPPSPRLAVAASATSTPVFSPIGGRASPTRRRRHSPPNAIRQMVPLPSSLTNSAPSRATATPTGRAQTASSSTTKPVMKSSYSPVGTPPSRGTAITFGPVRLPRFHDPWSDANAAPLYFGGNAALL